MPPVLGSKTHPQPLPGGEQNPPPTPPRRGAEPTPNPSQEGAEPTPNPSQEGAEPTPNPSQEGAEPTPNPSQEGSGEEIPQVLSNIVLKLMAKTAEERYQSAFGIKADLEECLHQLLSNGEIAEFTLGSQDISAKFQIPQKLYGREVEKLKPYLQHLRESVVIRHLSFVIRHLSFVIRQKNKTNNKQQTTKDKQQKTKDK